MNKIVIYGAGFYGHLLYEAITEKERDVAYFIDQYTPKKELNGKIIVKPENVENIDQDIKNTDVFVSIGFNNIDDIKSLLKEKGYNNNIYGFTDTVRLFPEFLYKIVRSGVIPWISHNKEKMLDYAKIEVLRHLLSDQKSKDLLDGIVKFRETLSPDDYIEPGNQVQYFPEDIDLFSNIPFLRLIDCGAFTGDTVEVALVYHDSVEVIVSFEPDHENLKKLIRNVEKKKALYPNTDFYIYPSGVWSSNTILSFDCKENKSSAVASDSACANTQIAAVSLDSTLIGMAPNYIKMDIEGAEREALIGSRNIISKYKPALAICVYHSPEDLWEIPLLIHSINPGYKMYLRLHGQMGLETVLYCVDDQSA